MPKEIDEKLAQAMGLIRECEEIAKRTGESFTFDITHGMGGEFVGKASRYESEEYLYGETSGWIASSKTC